MFQREATRPHAEEGYTQLHLRSNTMAGKHNKASGPVTESHTHCKGLLSFLTGSFSFPKGWGAALVVLSHCTARQPGGEDIATNITVHVCCTGPVSTAPSHTLVVGSTLLCLIDYNDVQLHIRTHGPSNPCPWTMSHGA